MPERNYAQAAQARVTGDTEATEEGTGGGKECRGQLQKRNGACRDKGLTFNHCRTCGGAAVNILVQRCLFGSRCSLRITSRCETDEVEDRNNVKQK